MHDQTEVEIYEEYGPRVKCSECHSEFFNDFKFCPSCGLKKGIKDYYVNSGEKVTNSPDFLSFFIYSLINIGLLAFYKFSGVFPDDDGSYFMLLIIFTVIDISFLLYNGFSSIPFSFKEVKLLRLLGLLGILTVAAFAVNFVANFLNTNIFDLYVEDGLENWSLWASILLVGVYPAVFEEIAYRGFLFKNIERLSSPKTAVWVTSIAFGLIHLTFISLIWLIPLGFIFARYRHKYNTIWYGVIGHFFYNTLITLLG